MVKLIKHWSNVFGLNCATHKHIPENFNFDLSLVKEEIVESFVGATKGSIRDYEDGLGDVLWTTIRAMLNAGIDPEKTIEAIYKSNMSKSCLSIEEAEATIESYKEKGIDTYHVEIDNYYIIKRKSDDKVLKSINFKEPIFE